MSQWNNSVGHLCKNFVYPLRSALSVHHWSQFEKKKAFDEVRGLRQSHSLCLILMPSEQKNMSNPVNPKTHSLMSHLPSLNPPVCSIWTLQKRQQGKKLPNTHTHTHTHVCTHVYTQHTNIRRDTKTHAHWPTQGKPTARPKHNPIRKNVKCEEMWGHYWVKFFCVSMWWIHAIHNPCVSIFVCLWESTWGRIWLDFTKADYSPPCRRTTVTQCIRRCVNVKLCVCVCVHQLRTLHPAVLMRTHTLNSFFIKTNRPHGQVHITWGGGMHECVWVCVSVCLCLCPSDQTLLIKHLSFPHTHSLIIETWGGEIHICPDSCDKTWITTQTYRQMGRHTSIHMVKLRIGRTRCIKLNTWSTSMSRCWNLAFFNHLHTPLSAFDSFSTMSSLCLLYSSPFSAPPSYPCWVYYTICGRDEEWM